MKSLIFAVFLLCLIALPSAYAIPNASSSVWFEGNETLHYSRGQFNVNWTAVTNENLSNYVVYINNGQTNETLFVYITTGPNITGILWSGENGINYTFKISAINKSGVQGPNATSDWILVDKVPAEIFLIPPTPPTGTYLKNNTLTLHLKSNEPLLSITLNWNGTREPANITYNGWGGGAYFYYISKNITAEGSYDYYLIVNDSATNPTVGEVRIANYDITPPSLILVSPQNIVYNSTRMHLNYSVRDMSPVSCEYNSGQYENLPLLNCMNTTFSAPNNTTTILLLWATDAAGNGNFTYVDFFVNETVPVSMPQILSEYPENGTIFESPSVTGSSVSSFIVITDNVAECRYSSTPGTVFENMTGRFRTTNSTVHNATIMLADGGNYYRYIRCKSVGGDANSEDYLLQYSTEPFREALVIDPEGILLQNNTMMLEMVGGKALSFNVSLKNDAYYGLSNISVSIRGSGAPYINITAPPAIAINSTVGMRFLVRAFREGTLNASVNVTSGIFSGFFFMNIVVYADYISELNALRIARQNISSRLYALQRDGADVNESVFEAERLQSEINDAYSLYNSGIYGAGREKAISIQNDMDALSANVNEIESRFLPPPTGFNSSVPPEYNYNSSDVEPPSSESSKNTGILIAAILLVIIVAIVLATSIMPDEDPPPPKKQRRFLSEDFEP